MSRDIPTLRGPYHPYAKQRLDWPALFDQLSRETPSRSIKGVAAEWGLPYETVRRRWNNYQQGLKEKDDTVIAVARGDVDGRRDNHRVFTREEEATLRSAIDQENVHPNKPVIQRLALDIHSKHQSTLPPANSTRSHPHADLTFHATDRFVERIKRDLGYSSQQPNIQRRYVKKKGKDWEEERFNMAIHYVDDVHRSVLRNGADFVINADEISAKVISPPRTLLAPKGGLDPPVIKSNKTHKEAFTMIFATTPSGKKLKPAVVLADRGPRAKQVFAHLTDSVHFMWGHRWYGEERWTQYMNEIIGPFCNGHPATFVVDSSPVHLTDLCADAAIERDIFTVVVPPGMTADLQPNDVQVYGPLTSVVRSEWLRQLRGEPEVYDSVPRAIERYLTCWGRISRQTIQKSWVKAIPLLKGLRNAKGSVDV
jgi:hypothetical protein